MTNAPSNLPAVQGQSDLPDGLEDTDINTDLTTPIYRIDHKKGVFVNGLTNEEMTTMRVILLGRIKQRILWPMVVEGDGGEQPMCRSYDFAAGIPRPETWVQPQKNNPALTAVKLSGWDYGQVEAAAESGDGLSCNNCPLKDWGKDKTPPWCNEQWTFPFIALDADGRPVSPGVISFQRTGLKSCKTYVSGFVQAKSALYTVVTELKAVLQQRGTVEWVTPSFKRVSDSDATEWEDYSRAFHGIKDFLTTPRTFTTEADPDEDEVAAATTTTVTVSQPAPAPAAPAPAPEPAPAPAPAAAPEPTQATVDLTEQTPAPAPRAQPATVPAAAPAAPTFEDEEPF